MLSENDLPNVVGSLKFGVDLAPFTWMRVGGPAGALFRPASEDDLAHFLAAKPTHIPHLVVGAASNLIIRDGGLPDTVVIRLGKEFRHMDVKGQRLTVGAAQLDLHVAKFAAQWGLGGFSFFAGVPGTIGGGVRMNAGARTTSTNAHVAGGETADRLLHARVLDDRGRIHHLSPHDMGMAYRHSNLPPNWIVSAAEFEGYEANPQDLNAEIDAVLKYRAQNQPTKARTCGSTFKNPEGHSAWKLIEKVGGRGMRRGQAEMSALHCNFLLNLGQAKASDLEDLGEDIRTRVKNQSGIDLEWEVKRVGQKA